MTGYQRYTRLRHFFTARHWRGYAVHSPFMYRFMREVVIRSSRKDLPRKIEDYFAGENITILDRVNQLPDKNISGLALIREPFFDRREETLWKEWYGTHHCAAVHFQGLMVIFFDKKLQKQFYTIRN